MQGAVAPGSAGATSGSVGGSLPNAFDFGKLVDEVEDAATRLTDAADRLYDATTKFEKAEQAYESEMAHLRLEADFDFAERHGNRLPSADRRQDMALRDIQINHHGVYTEYFAAKAEREAALVAYRALAAAVSARQSLLKAVGVPT